MKKNLLICLILVLLTGLGSIKTNAQSSSAGTVFSTGYYLGWNNYNQNLDFGFGTPYTPFMSLTPAGNFGIGPNFITPNNRLDVDSGDIDVNMPVFSYKIGDSAVLHYRGDATYTVPKISNIFVGVGAGQHNTTGDSNVMVGFHAGYSNAIESQETFVGFQAGQNTHSGRGNTFVGSLAGHDNDFGQGNVFMGVRAGYATFGSFGSLLVGCYNTFVGNYCGENNTTGLGNSFYGKHAGADNQNGNFNVSVGNHSGEFSTAQVLNTFIGYHSGRNNKGDTNVIAGAGAGEHSSGNNNCFYGGRAGDGNNGSYNTYIGHRANFGATNFTNSTALGANTIVMASKTMILGDNNINVGIGLSGILPAPQNKLEINYSVQNDDTAPTVHGGTGFSGLRFRDLTINSNPWSINPGKGVLAVDSVGNVIYVPDLTGNGFGLPCPHVASDPLWDLPLYTNWRVGLSGNTLVFEDGNVWQRFSNHVGIGYSCKDDLYGKLSVNEPEIDLVLKRSIAGYFRDVADSTKAIGVCGIAIDNVDGVVSYGGLLRGILHTAYL